jgi:hypothetical protein
VLKPDASLLRETLRLSGEKERHRLDDVGEREALARRHRRKRLFKRREEGGEEAKIVP